MLLAVAEEWALSGAAVEHRHEADEQAQASDNSDLVVAMNMVARRVGGGVHTTAFLNLGRVGHLGTSEVSQQTWIEAMGCILVVSDV